MAPPFSSRRASRSYNGPVKHFSEAELLETWFEAPGSSLPTMLHVADCAACAQRYERLEAKFDSLFTCPHPNARQRRALGRTAATLVAAAVLLTFAWRFVA